MLTVYDISDLKALPLVFQFVAKTTGQRVCERLAFCLEIRDRSSITLLVSDLMFCFPFVPTPLSTGVTDEYHVAFRHLALSHRDYLQLDRRLGSTLALRRVLVPEHLWSMETADDELTINQWLI
jgi:hypothetical protein